MVARIRKVARFAASARDITAHDRTRDALRRLNETLEQQAKQIAQRLHDDAGQLLTSAHIALADAGRDLPPDVSARLRAVGEYLERLDEQLRRLAHELHPKILDDLGLVSALEFVAEGVERRRGISITIDAALRTRLPPVMEATLYRLVQDALADAGKHSRAGAVHVWLRQGPRVLRCTIENDGIDAPAMLARFGGRGLGFLASRDRLVALGGTLKILSSAGRGTKLVIRIPLDA
jgi:signal transduction histidine kinase